MIFQKTGIILVLTTAWLAGCAGPPQVMNVDNLVIMTPQSAMNFDAKPGADGVQVRVYFFQGPDAKPVLGDGVLKMELYDGRLRGPSLSTAKPIKIWEFTTEQLKNVQGQTATLWNYQLVLLWGESHPTKRMVTLRGNFIPKNGTMIYSKPVSIPVSK